MYASRIGVEGEALTYGRKAGVQSPERLARQYMPLVRKIAWHVHGRVSNAIEIEDLLQIGMVALVEAANGYEDRGFGFARLVLQCQCAGERFVVDTLAANDDRVQRFDNLIFDLDFGSIPTFACFLFFVCHGCYPMIWVK